MTEQPELHIDASWKGVVKWGGVSLFASAICLVIFILSVFVLQQKLPLPAKEVLEDPVAPTNLFLLAALGELLLMPGGLALYFSLKDIRKTNVFIAAGLWLTAVPMFLASRGLILSLSPLSGKYLGAADETMKAAYLASAELAIETQNIYAMMGLMLLCVASIIIGLVMLKGIFGKRFGYLVITAGALTLFSPFGVIMQIPIVIPFIGLALTAVWQLIGGAKLYRLGRDA
jgi:hypothetical protein